MTTAIILAGGLGTRLRSVVADLPKPMAPVRGIPFLTYLLETCYQANINNVILAVGYKHDTISGHFGSHYKTVELNYAIEHEPLGTGGGIRQALELLNDDEPVLILNGDTMFNLDLNAFLEQHLDTEADVSLALKPMHNFDRYGVVEFDETGRITAFLEKMPRLEGHINGGVYALSPSVVTSRFQLGEKWSFEQAFLEKELHQLNFQAFISNGYFIDIGIPEDFEKAQHTLSVDSL